MFQIITESRDEHKPAREVVREKPGERNDKGMVTSD
jgi:hypothetical protein